MAKFKKIIISLLIISIFCAILPACSTKYNYEEVKQEFSQYEADLNTAIVLDSRNIYFNDRVVELHKLVPEDSYSHFQLIDNEIYISAKEKVNWNTVNLTVYKCDIYGNNLERIFIKENLTKPVKDIFNGETFYFQYKADGDKVIDSYDLITGKYVNVTRGGDCNIDNYKQNIENKYIRELNRNSGEFTITDAKTLETFSGGEEYLKQTPYYNSLNKYPYKLDSIVENEERLYFVYRLRIEEFFDLSPDYTFAVFEFDFTNKQLEYKLITQMYDIEYYSIICV